MTTPVRIASRTSSELRSIWSGRPFVSTAVPVSAHAANTVSRSTAFGGRWLMIPALRMADRPQGRMVHRLERALRQLVSRLPLPRVHRRLHPLELIEDVVRQVERAVGEDVALAAAQHAERRELIVRGGDLFGLTAKVVGVEAGDDPNVTRVVADRDVLIPERACRFGHFEHGRLPVRPHRVHVQVTADRRLLDERRRLA
jgi:hypothetical protein